MRWSDRPSRRYGHTGQNLSGARSGLYRSLDERLRKPGGVYRPVVEQLGPPWLGLMTSRVSLMLRRRVGQRDADAWLPGAVATVGHSPVGIR